MCKRILASQTNAEGGIPFYKIGTIGGTPDAYISKELFDEYKEKYNYPHKGEVMITCAGTVGKCVIYDGKDAYYQDSNIVWIDNPSHNISNGFLCHLLSNVDWRKLNSTTIIRIYNDDLRNLKLNYPLREEQQRISKLLSLLDERIATQNKIIDKLQSLIKGICNNYFEKLSVQEEANLTRLSDVLKERNEYCTKDGKFIHGTLSKDGIFPKTGRWDRDFLVKQENKKYKVTHLDDICYNPANLKFGVICRNTFGDLIFSPIYVTFEVCKNVNIGFMELYLTNHNFIEKVRRFEQGTVYERMAVSPEDFLSYKIRIPSYSDQTFFYKKVQWLITLSQNEMKLLSQYKKLRQYLLREMFI